MIDFHAYQILSEVVYSLHIFHNLAQRSFWGEISGLAKYGLVDHTKFTAEYVSKETCQWLTFWSTRCNYEGHVPESTELSSEMMRMPICDDITEMTAPRWDKLTSLRCCSCCSSSACVRDHYMLQQSSLSVSVSALSGGCLSACNTSHSRQLLCTQLQRNVFIRSVMIIGSIAGLVRPSVRPSVCPSVPHRLLPENKIA